MRHRRKTGSTDGAAVEALLHLSIFAGCIEADLGALVEDTDVVRVPASTIIDSKGTPARQFVGIVDGYLRGFDPVGRPFVLGPGDHIGARELLTDELHAATYMATTTVTLVSVFGPTFRSRARLIPGLVERASAPRRDRAISQPLAHVS